LPSDSAQPYRYTSRSAPGGRRAGAHTIPRRIERDDDRVVVGPAGHGADDEEGLGARRDRVGQLRVRAVVGKILLAGEDSQEGSAFLCDVIADRPANDRIARLERVQDGTLGDRAVDGDLHLAVDVGQGAEMRGQHDTDHGSVWTSTDTTDGRSRTIG